MMTGYRKHFFALQIALLLPLLLSSASCNGEILYRSVEVNISGNGSVVRDPEDSQVREGISLSLQATADTLWRFDGWYSGETFLSSDNPYQLRVDDDLSLTARFSEIPVFSLSVGTQGSGTVQKDPDQSAFWDGESVTLRATAAEGWQFDGWYEGAAHVSSSNPYSFVMTENISLTALFSETPVSYTLEASWLSVSSDSHLSSAEISSVSSLSQPLSIEIADYGSRVSGTGTDTTRIVVKYDDGMSASRSSGTALLDSFGTGRPLNLPPELGSYGVISVSSSRGSDNDTLLQQIRNTEGVIWAEYDSVMKVHAVPNDPGYPLQWNFARLDMPALWDVQQGLPAVTVAVVDTGIRRYLQDFSTTAILQGYNTITESLDVDDDNGHGTHVSGTVAQSTNNGYGVAGMAWGVSLLPVKALDAAGEGFASDIAEAITYAVDQGSDVINLSIGGGSSLSIEDAIGYAVANDVVVVASSGNDNISPVSYPARYPGVIGVGATGYEHDLIAPYSNYGDGLDVVAPGGNLDQTFEASGYGPVKAGIYQQVTADEIRGYQGTSMAAPHVSALAALLLSKEPDLSAQEVSDIITSSSEDLGDAGYDQLYGWGLINPSGALDITYYRVSDTVTATIGTSTSWTFSAAAGVVSASLVSDDPESLSLTLEDSLGTVVATAVANEGMKKLEYHVEEGSGGSYSLTVSLIR